MLVDLKNRLNDLRIQELIGYCVFPDPAHIKKTISKYKDQKNLKLVGYESEGKVIGIIGYTLHSNKMLEIKHICVIPSERRKGYGRKLIAEIINHLNPLEIHAETDQYTVDFYKNNGFTITSLGEKYPGVERFKCIYKTE